MGLRQDMSDRWRDAVRGATEDEQAMTARAAGRSGDEVADLVHPLLAALEESIEQLAHAVDELRGRMPPRLQ